MVGFCLAVIAIACSSSKSEAVVSVGYGPKSAPMLQHQNLADKGKLTLSMKDLGMNCETCEPASISVMNISKKKDVMIHFSSTKGLHVEGPTPTCGNSACKLQPGGAPVFLTVTCVKGKCKDTDTVTISL